MRHGDVITQERRQRKRLALVRARMAPTHTPCRNEDFVHVVPELMSKLSTDPESVLTTIENALREVQQLIFNELQDFPVSVASGDVVSEQNRHRTGSHVDGEWWYLSSQLVTTDASSSAGQVENVPQERGACAHVLTVPST